jgi:hypothetical protein
MKTFDQIMKELFYNKTAWFVDMFGKIKSNKTTLYLDRNNCTSNKHVEKWLCINDLMNIAHGLNESWEPNWNNDTEFKFYIVSTGQDFEVMKTNSISQSFVYFKTEDLAKEAITILGNEKLMRIFVKP